MDIFGTCNDPKFTSAPVVSDILDAPDLTGTDDGNGGWHLTSFATVRKDAKPGSWPVSFMCGTTNVVGNLQVEAPDQPLPRAEIAVEPHEGLPGAKVDVLVLCSEPAAVKSKALTVGKLEPLPKKDGDVHPWFGAVGTVNDVKPGVYEVATNCGVAEITTKFTVLGDAPAPQKKKAQVPVKPKGAADTGSLDVAPAPEQQDTGLYVLGGSALAALGAVGGVGAWAYRRRQRA